MGYLQCKHGSYDCALCPKTPEPAPQAAFDQEVRDADELRWYARLMKLAHELAMEGRGQEAQDLRVAATHARNYRWLRDHRDQQARPLAADRDRSRHRHVVRVRCGREQRGGEMSDKYTELRRLAEAATPGVWVKRSHPMMPSFVQAQRLNPSDPYDIEIMGEDDTLYPTREADVDFIAAANPTTILALLDELAAPQALNKRIAEEIRRLAAKCGDQSWADEMRREADILEGTK